MPYTSAFRLVARRRVATLRSQLSRLLRLIEEDTEALTVLNQARAIQKAMVSLQTEILHDHFRSEFPQQLATSTSQAIQEVMEAIKR